MLETRCSTTGTRPWAVPFRAADPHKIPIDPNGNLTTKTEGTDNWTYEWNANNQLSRVTKNGVEQVRFSYDPMGRRVEKIAGGVTTAYAYEGSNVLRETRGGSTLKYVHGRLVDEPLAVEDGGQATYLHADGLGSVVKGTNSAGAVTLVREYDAWGNLGSGSDQAGFAYTGREWDPEIGLYYYRARYYDPRAARFVSEDPIGFKGGLNLYGYVDDDPVNWADPSGLCPCRVTVRCRPVHHPVPEKVSKVSGGTVVPVHCYVVGTNSSGGNTTYTGGPSGGFLGAWPQPGFPSNKDDSIDDPIIWQGEVPCDKLNCLQQATQTMGGQKHKYNPIGGPNSNSVAGGITFACQIPATFPGGATGSDHFRPHP